MDHVHVIFCLRPQVPINKADTRPGHGDGSELKKETRPGFDNDQQNCAHDKVLLIHTGLTAKF